VRGHAQFLAGGYYIHNASILTYVLLKHSVYISLSVYFLISLGHCLDAWVFSQSSWFSRSRFRFPHLVRADLFSLYVARALMHAALKVKMAKPTFVLAL